MEGLGNNRNWAKFIHGRKTRWLFPSLRLTPAPTSRPAQGQGPVRAGIAFGFNMLGGRALSVSFFWPGAFAPQERAASFEDSPAGVEPSPEGRLQACPPHPPRGLRACKLEFRVSVRATLSFMPAAGKEPRTTQLPRG